MRGATRSIRKRERSAEAVIDPLPGEPGDGRASASRSIRLNLRTSLVLQVLNVISGLELARGLGLLRRGELAAAVLWPTVIGAVATLGLQESMTYHVAREPGKTGRLLGSALTLCAIQSVLFTIVTLIAVPLALGRHDAATISSGLIYSGYVSINVFGLAFSGALNGLHRYGSYNAALLSTGVSIVGAQTILLAVGDFSVRTLVLAFIGCYVGCLLFGGWLTRRAYPGPLEVDWKTIRMIFSYGVRSNTSTTSSFLNQRLDQLVISAFLSARQLGLYVVAVTFTLFTPMLGGAIALAALPNIARLDDPAERSMLARRLVSLTLIASILVSVPIVVLAPILIKVFFGPAFAVGANITRVTAIASVSFATTRSLEAVLRGSGAPLTAGMAELVALAATIVGLATLLPTLGLIGAAWASLLAYSVSGAWMTWRLKRILGIPVRQLLTPDREGLEVLRCAFQERRGRPR